MSYPLVEEKGYTYEDYRSWPENERWEIIDGVAYNMSPAPSIKHQILVVNFAHTLKNSLTPPCRTFVSPTDVVLDNTAVVQPDIFVVCSPEIVTDANIQGPPDLIIEVLSASTAAKDKKQKKALYERFGVREYIIVSPEYEFVERYVHCQNEYGKAEVLNWDETLSLKTFGLSIDLWEIFEKEKAEHPAEKRDSP